LINKKSEEKNPIKIKIDIKIKNFNFPLLQEQLGLTVLDT
jgi:hypothetical protein